MWPILVWKCVCHTHRYIHRYTLTYTHTPIHTSILKPTGMSVSVLVQVHKAKYRPPSISPPKKCVYVGVFVYLCGKYALRMCLHEFWHTTNSYIHTYNECQTHTHSLADCVKGLKICVYCVLFSHRVYSPLIPQPTASHNQTPESRCCHISVIVHFRLI